MDKTEEEIKEIQKKVFELQVRGEVPAVVEEYIELLQSIIYSYQSELFTKNSKVSRLEFAVKAKDEQIIQLKESLMNHKSDK